MFDFFKRKSKQPNEVEGLEKALKLGLITKEELLILKIKRAEKDLKEMGVATKRSHHKQRP